MAGIHHSESNRRHVRWSVTWRTGLWLLLTIGVAELTPLLFLACHAPGNPGPEEAMKSFLGHSVLVLVAVGVFLATVADSLTERRHFYRISWIGVVTLGFALLWLVEVTVVNDFVHKQPPSEWAIIKQVGLCVGTLLFCATEKALGWYERFSELP